MRRHLVAVLPLVLSTVGSWASPSDPGQAPPRPPDLRLGDDARPTRYAARLRVIPGEATFSGTIDIDLTLARPARVVWLHGAELKIASARFELAASQLPAKATTSGRYLGFVADRELPAGPLRLHVEYSGAVQQKDDRGLFAQQEGGRHYAYTQLEAISARRVFPCFDEPRFKVPWQLTVEAPRDDVVISNTAPVSERSERPDTRTVVFAPTPPLPSYLVTLAVGPFDLVDIGRGGRAGVPMRIAAPAGRAADVRFAAKATGPILDALEDYFGSRFPYDKLDQVSVPQPTSFGAMENPAMITWLQSWIVARPQDESVGFQRTYVEVAAHEIAHQWFGDLVTLAWWDDTWLNESFASWLAGRVVDRLYPDWSRGTHAVEVRADAMRADALASARPIRQAIAGEDDIFNAFDLGITYNKGEAVLGMFERFVGEETFQRAIRAYIADHAGGNATAADLFAALGAAAGRDLAPAIGTFLDQPGVPLVHATPVCAPGKPAQLALAQERYVPLGTTAAPQTWQVPVCVTWGARGKTGRACHLLSEARATVALPGLDGCPDWLLANDDAAGYYRVDLDAAGAARLLGARSPLALPEVVGVMDDLKAMVARGSLPIGDALALMPRPAADPRRQVVERALAIAGGLRDDLMPDALQPRYARYVQRLFGARARKLGWQPRPGEDEDTRLLRPRLVGLVADEGRDPALRAQAALLARRWLGDRKAVAADVIDEVLAAAVRDADRALRDALLAEARRAPERRDRVRILNALGRLRDPALLRETLALVLSPDFDARESDGLLFNAFGTAATRAVAWDFIKSSYEAIEARWAADTLAALPSVVASFCDEAHRDEMRTFFKERSARIPGGPHLLAQAVESAEQCIAQQRAQAASAAAFLSR